VLAAPAIRAWVRGVSAPVLQDRHVTKRTLKRYTTCCIRPDMVSSRQVRLRQMVDRVSQKRSVGREWSGGWQSGGRLEVNSWWFRRIVAVGAGRQGSTFLPTCTRRHPWPMPIIIQIWGRKLSQPLETSSYIWGSANCTTVICQLYCSAYHRVGSSFRGGTKTLEHSAPFSNPKASLRPSHHLLKIFSVGFRRIVQLSTCQIQLQGCVGDLHDTIH
jgi:hypothetical protein